MIRKYALASFAALLVLQAPARSQSVPTVRVATLPIDVASQALYAKDEGFFQAAGLNVEITLMSNGGAIAAGVAGGSLDLGASNLVNLAAGYENHVPYVLVAPGGAYSDTQPTSKLVVTADSAIKTAKDMAGKTIAVNLLNSIDSVGVLAWIDKNGGDSKLVKLVEMPYPTIGPAVAKGSVDVGSIDEPFLGDAISTNHLRAVGLPLDAVTRKFVEGAFFCTRDYATAHPDVIRKFADAMAKAADWANAHPDLSAKVLEKYSGRPLAPGAARTYFLPRFTRAQAQPLLDVAYKYGALKTPVQLQDMFAPGITFAQ
jgi:NitT/TauT family transport system substrate-binding protein